MKFARVSPPLDVKFFELTQMWQRDRKFGIHRHALVIQTGGGCVSSPVDIAFTKPLS